MMHSTAQSIDDSGFELSESDVRAEEDQAPGVSQEDVSWELLDRFRQACGQLSRMRIRINSAESGAVPKPLLWDRPSLIVGSGEDCDLRLPHAEVSSRHAYFQLIGGRLYCADLESSTGTHWSQGASQAGWVEAKEPVAIGPYSLTFAFKSRQRSSDTAELESAGPPDPIGSADTDEIPIAADMFLDFVNAGPKVRRYRVTRDVTLIGSGNGVKIHLTHPSVSNAHCSVVRTPTGLWIVDLLSAEGTIVNGQVVPLAALQPGDEFQVGRFLVAVHYGLPEQSRASSLQIRSDNGQPVKASTEAAMPYSQSGRSVADGQQVGPSDPGNQWTPLDAAQHTADMQPPPSDGLSEEFVLNIVREMGVMQQQSLRQVQDSLTETLSQLSSAYDQRLDALERGHTVLRNQLGELAPAASAGPRAQTEMPIPGDPAPLPVTESVDDAAVSDQQPELRDRGGPPPVDNQEPHPPQQPPPTAEEDLRDRIDAVDSKQWIREQIKSLECDLDQTGREWGKKLVELLGH